MYSRRLGSEQLSFGVSGKLWHGVLVMFDRESGTLWTQLDGRAITGEREGQRLEHRESTFTSWSRWVAAQPDTLVLEKDEESRSMQASHYAEYFADPEELMFAHLSEGLGEELGPKEVVFGVTIESGPAGSGRTLALAITERALEGTGVRNVVVAERALAFLRSPATGRVIAVERELAGRVLVLAPLAQGDPTVIALDTESEQRIEIESLPSLRVDRAYWYAWARSHPGSSVLGD